MTNTAAAESSATYGDYCGWEGRWELIDGEIFDMSAAPSRAHQDLLLGLAVQLDAYFTGHRCRLYIAPFDVRLPDGDEVDDHVRTVVQPDLAVICDPTKLDAPGCRGAPDWVIEVLSPSTAARDQIKKRWLYERHGVREYWLVHPFDHLVTIYRLQSDGRYAPPEIREMAGTQEQPLFDGLTIDWAPVLERLS